ncbi:MAG: hypothetical protein ACC628_17225 [Pirellulaceae bacterium]
MLTNGTLWRALEQASEKALASGAQQPIPTEFHVLEDQGVPFIVRVVERFARKVSFPDEANRGNGNVPNPFLPYDPEMFVADISPTHVGLLNKYNVVDHHLLIVTREFEAQESLLTLADFEALWTCMAEIPSLGFYNSGPSAGASQPHKHLQWVRLPLSEHSPHLPIESLLEPWRLRDEMGRAESLPFAHAIVRIEGAGELPPSQLAASTTVHYRSMLRTLGLNSTADDGVERPSPYNLLITQDWMMLVPRSRECFGSISLNALAFAGTFLVRDEARFRELESLGPMAALRHVGVSARS